MAAGAKWPKCWDSNNNDDISPNVNNENTF